MPNNEKEVLSQKMSPFGFPLYDNDVGRILVIMREVTEPTMTSTNVLWSVMRGEKTSVDIKKKPNYQLLTEQK